jgi:hypothetical protein
MLGVVALVTRPVAGAVWIVVSVVLVRLLNGRFEPPAQDELVDRLTSAAGVGAQPVRS